MYIQTAGSRFSYADLDANTIDITEIALSLSHLARFNGHTTEHLSVAQHSVGVALYLARSGADREVVLAGLLHDAHEAYMGDIATPFKQFIGPSLKTAEHRIQTSVALKLGVPMTLIQSSAVKLADLVALLAERNALLPKDSQPWEAERHVQPHQLALYGPVVPWSRDCSYFTFLWLYEKLTGKAVTPKPNSWWSAIAYRWYALKAYQMVCRSTGAGAEAIVPTAEAA